MDNNEQVFKRHFEQGMVVKNYNAFKHTHPTLLKCILNAMAELSGTKTGVVKKIVNNCEHRDIYYCQVTGGMRCKKCKKCI